MSLIKCSECGKKFSDKADSCPKCSCPISEIKKVEKNSKNAKAKKAKEKKQKTTFKQRIKNNVDSIKKSKKKQIILLSITVCLIISMCVFLFLTVFNNDWKIACKNYESAYKVAEKKNNDLEKLMIEAEKLVYSDNTALDENLRPALETSISEAKSALKDLPGKSLFIKNIKSKTNKLNKIDYTAEYEKLKNDYDNLDKSIRKYKLVYQPTEAYVIDCLKNVKYVKNIAAVTEENDPNGHLNKPGGYTATVYYSDDRIKLDKDIYGKTVIEQGTDGGGAIEVYATVEDAEERRDYLSAYDGGILANGTHTVVGTVLVRTSNELTATQQKEMESAIIEALTKLEEPDTDTSSSTK